MGKTKYLSAFERGTVVGARHIGLCEELQRCWVFNTQTFPVRIKNGQAPTGHPANWTAVVRIGVLWTAVVSIGVNMGQHPCGTLSTPCRVHVLIN